MKSFFFFVVTLIICQYFISQITIDASPIAVKKFTWALPIHDNPEEEFAQHHVKRKLGPGMFNSKNPFPFSLVNYLFLGWGKRSNLMIDEQPENSARIWFEDK
jgi:hypothetical protein